VLPRDRASALKELASAQVPTDSWLRIERTLDAVQTWTVRAVVSAGLNLADESAAAPALVELLVSRGLVKQAAEVHVTTVLTPRDVALHLHGGDGRLYGPASASPWRGLVRPSINTGVLGLVRAGGGVSAGPGLPYAVQTGEVIADLIGRPTS
jgi:hypothetical protein